MLNPTLMHVSPRRSGLAMTVALCLSLLALASPSAAAAAADDNATNANAQTSSSAQQSSVVGWLELAGPLRDGPVPYAWVNQSDVGPSLRDVVHQLERIAAAEHYLGAVIFLDQPQLSLTQVNAISDAMRKVSDAGKKVFTFAESYDLQSYLLASSADTILLQHRGRVHLKGLALEEMYLAGLLEMIGAKADLMQVGRFKDAADPMMRTSPSPGWDQNMGALLDDLYEQIIERIADGRGMTRQQVTDMIADSWTMTDQDYIKRRVVDQLTDRDLVQVTELAFGNNFVWDDALGRANPQTQQAQNPFALFQMLFQKPETTTSRQSIAVIHATGPIVSGHSTRGDGPFASNRIGSKSMIKLLGQVRDDDNIKGAVIRIHSPGGSALRGEVI